MSAEVIVIGAGISGLAFACALARSGVGVAVLEKSAGVGGRCATRRVDGQPVDHGLCFLHGSAPEFVAAIQGVSGATPIPGWPVRVRGQGRPCQPRAYRPTETRVAFAEGVSAFPKGLAGGLDIRRRVVATGIETATSGFRVITEEGTIDAGGIMLGLPTEQASALLDTLEDQPKDVAAARGLLSMIGSVPCLTVIAGYPPSAPTPDWDVLYPEDSSVLHLVSHDSTKRRDPAWSVLVYQARPCWSHQRIDDTPERWAAGVLAEAGRALGSWAAEPAWHQAHRWRFARADAGNELTGPLLLSVGEGLRLGLAGEIFAPGGGAEAAWLAGTRLARRWLDEERT